MMGQRPIVVLALLISAVLLPRRAAAQYCPSYTYSSTYNDHDCGIEAVPGTNPSNAEWQDIFDLVAKGPDAWGDAGPNVSDIGQGCGKPQAYQSVTARFPCELIKAIARIESGWQQFCVPTSPADQKGGQERTIISFDCGYGVGQVTSGMHTGESPDFDRERVAGDATYNLATGMQILAAKWKVTECVGDNQPSIIEDWYSATWAYNGLAYKNNPNNPDYDPNRGVWNPDVGGSAPYQEKVFGRMEYPKGQWEPTLVAYPNAGEIGSGNKPPELSEPSCASPTDCTDQRPVHVSICHDSGDGGGGGSAGGAAGSPSAGVGGSPAQGGSPPETDPESSGGIPGSNNGCSCAHRAPPVNSSAWIALLLLSALGAARQNSRIR